MSDEGPAGEHKARSPRPASIRVALVTASDSRTPATNEGGRLLARLCGEAGFTIVEELLLVEDPTQMRTRVAALARPEVADAVLITGGTGLGPRDRTPEAVSPLFERRLPGFGELFRMLSFRQVGAAAMLSRAEAGVAEGIPIFLLPGSPAAIELAVRELIAPELPHLIGQLRRPATK
ncbi:MAG TPA: MogA/MoaB family molybdenum cofactor biosynthesis protein [Polyangia bacterium]|jgi:molybdenum cofactor biosynthesis protein B